MKSARKVTVGMATIAGLLATICTASHGQTVIDEWAAAKFPAPPALKPATIIPNETAPSVRVKRLLQAQAYRTARRNRR